MTDLKYFPSLWNYMVWDHILVLFFEFNECINIIQIFCHEIIRITYIKIIRIRPLFVNLGWRIRLCLLRWHSPTITLCQSPRSHSSSTRTFGRKFGRTFGRAFQVSYWFDYKVEQPNFDFIVMETLFYSLQFQYL